MEDPALHRVEAQLMLLESPLDRPVPYASRYRPHARMFLEVPLAHIVSLPPRDPELTVACVVRQSAEGDAAAPDRVGIRGTITSTARLTISIGRRVGLGGS